MSGSSATSTLDIVLKDDVSANAKAVAASLEKLQSETKAVDEALARSGTRDGLQARLKSLDASREQIEGVAKAWRDYAEAEELAADKGAWTGKQAAAVKNWENVTVAGLRAIRGEERAREFAAAADARKAEERRDREAKARVAEAERVAKTEADAARRTAQVAERDERQRAERAARDEARRREADAREAERDAKATARDERRRTEQAERDAARVAEAEARDRRRLAEQEERDERQRVERRMRDDRMLAEHQAREEHRAAEAAHQHQETLAHQREHFAERQGFRHFALQSAAMAVSAHAMVHVGERAWEQGAELQHERIGLRNAGRTPEEIGEIEHAARSVQAATPTSGYIESLKTIAETTAAFGSVHHAIENLPFISKMTSILKTAGGDNIHGDAAQLGQAFAKTFEERQTKAEDFQSEAKQMIPAMVATGGTFNPEQLYAFAQQAKSALPSLSMRFLSRIAPSLIGAQGGERAGTALKAFEDVIAGKVNDKKQAEAFLNMGLLDPKMAIMKAGHAVGWKSGAIKDTTLAMTDPLAWSEQYLIPALKKELEKKGLDTSDREAVQMILNTMFRNQNANMFATEIAQEASRNRLHKDEELYNRVGSFDDIYARNLQDFGVAAGALKSALGNLAGAVTVPLMGKVSAGLITLADGINHLSNLALEHPTLAATTGMAAAAGSLAAAARIGYGLYNGFGLGASATALTGSAHAIDAAAGRLGMAGGPGGLPGKVPGAIVPAGGSVTGVVVAPAAVELGAAAVAGGGAVALTALVKAAFEAQQPGNGGQWSPATLATRSDDQQRLEDQQAEADRLQAEIDRNKRMEKLPGTSDTLNIPLMQQLKEKLNQVENTRRSLAEIDADASHEARVGRAMMKMRAPEVFGPDMPAGRGPHVDREGEHGRAFATMRRPEEFGPQREAAGPGLPADVALRLGYVERELARGREAARPWQPAPFPPDVPSPSPAVSPGYPGLEKRTFGRYLEMVRPAAAAGEMPAAIPPPANPLSAAPGVDTSRLHAAADEASQVGSAMQAALNLTASPQVDASSIDAAHTRATEAGAAIQAALNVTASPQVNVGSIEAAQAAAERLVATLRSIGAIAHEAAAAVASVGGAGARPARASPAGRAARSRARPPRSGDVMLFQLGLLTFDCPGPLNADETSEEFGADYAVKAVVGAQQPREFVGPADHKFVLSGELLPYFHTRIGIGSGLGEVATLQAMAAGGEPQILVRGDGTNLGWWLIERGSLKSTRLSGRGIGHVIHYTVNLVESPVAPSAGSLFSLIEQLFA